MRSISITVVLLSPFLLASSSLGRTWESGLEGSIGSRATPADFRSYMEYRYYLPAGYDPSATYPLVLYLHGASSAGGDNDRQVQVDIAGLIAKTETEYPAILVVPQLRLSSQGWQPVRTVSNDRTLDILGKLDSELSINHERIYLTGYSMGGVGTMSYLYHTAFEAPSDWSFAAAAAIAGAYPWEDAIESIREVPLWLIHGDSDTIVNPGGSRDTFRAIAGLPFGQPIAFGGTELGAPTARSGVARYTEIVGGTHDIATGVYWSNDFYNWMFDQSRNSVPEPASWMLLLVVSSLSILPRHRRSP